MELQLGSKKVYYEDIGAGQPLALVHGGLGHDHSYFLPWVEPLARERRLILIDLMGNGRSDPPDDWSTVNDVAIWVDQLHAMREALGFERWSLLGHSFGGFVAQTYALEHPTDLDALIVCTSSAKVDHLDESFAVAQTLATPAQLRVMTEELFAPMSSDEHYRRVWNAVFPVYFFRPDADVLRGIDARMIYRGEAFNAAVRALPGIDLLDRLGELEMPVLVMGATQDWAFPPAAGPRLIHERVPGSTYVEIPDAGHYPFVEQPEAFNTAVSDFLRSVKTPPPSDAAF